MAEKAKFPEGGNFRNFHVRRFRGTAATNGGKVKIPAGRKLSEFSRSAAPAGDGRMKQAWTDSDLAMLLHLRDNERLGWTEIAARLGRPPLRCSSRYSYECSKQGRLRTRVSPAGMKSAAEKAAGPVQYDKASDPHRPPQYRQAPAAVERVREALAQARRLQEISDPAGTVLGDPPPGFTELDAWRARQAQEAERKRARQERYGDDI